MQPSHVDRVLSSYQHIGDLVSSTMSKSSRDDVHNLLRYFLLDMPVVPVLLACHSLFASLSIYNLTRGRQFWLKSLILTAFAAFGGSTLANLLSASPAPLFTNSSNYMMSYIFVFWYLVNHSPLLRYIFSFRLPRALLAFGATAAKARAIMSFIDAFVPRFPTAVAGAIALGGLSGSGGSLFVTVEKIVQNGLDTPSEFSNPGWGFKSAYIAALVYYVGTDPVGWVAERVPFEWGFQRDDMRFAVSFMLCTHAMLETLYGRHVNPVWGLERVLYAVTGVNGSTESEVCVDGTQTAAVVDGAEKVAGKVDAQSTVKKFGANGLRRREGKGRSE